MSGIFINYRREDSAGHAGRLADSLRAHLGLRAHLSADQIFMDVDGIRAGVDYIKVIETAVSSCDVVIAVIGRRWLSSTDADGHRRLDDPDDLLTVEIGTALRRDICVIPVLVQGASPPRSSDLPPALAGLARRQAFEIRDARWTQDIDVLVQALKGTLATTGTDPHPTPGPVPTGKDDERSKPARPGAGGRGATRARSAQRNQLQDEHRRSQQSDELGRDAPPGRAPSRQSTRRPPPSARGGWIRHPQTWVTLAAIGSLVLIGVIWILVHSFVPTGAPVKWATVKERFGAALRASPSSDADIVLTKKCGDALEVVSTTTDGWVEVKGPLGRAAGGQTGYVGYARVTIGPQPATPTCSDALTFTVGSTAVAADAKGCVDIMPRGSRTELSLICYQNGQRLQILNGPNNFSGNDDWFKVRTMTGPSPALEGWALATSLALP